MRGKILGGLCSAVSEPSGSSEPPAEQASAGKRHVNKKLFVVIAAVAAIAIIVVALFFVPQGSADVISLGVDYAVGEKLTYAITTTMSTDYGNSSMNLSSDSTLTIEVVSFDGGVYTLNYTTTSSALGYSMTTSKLIEVQESEMVTALALLPVAFQQYATTLGNTSNPLVTAVFDKSEAKVGDTWTIPLSSADSGSSSVGDLTVTFKAIQDLSVEAGNFRVFRIDFATNMQENQGASSSYNMNMNVELSGQSYLETGTCKQVKSVLDMTMGYTLMGSDYSVTAAITNTLTHDAKP